MDEFGFKQGGFAKHGEFCYKILSMDKNQACLIDYDNKHHGCYPFNELKPIKRVKAKTVWIEDR